MEAAGVIPEDYASPDDCIDDGIHWDAVTQDWCYPLWPENWPPLQTYLRIQTQWRCDMNGRTGLDYNVLFHELDRASLDPVEYDDRVDAIRVIERTVLDIK